ncbi:MAG TPA: hypothetical protein VFG54_11340 [Prolixibacteraceae bacterium]|nr:hypothetical protein [Prolixibacteraceae bacterium]
MNYKTIIGLIFFVALITVGCSKDSTQDPDLVQGSDLSYDKKATIGATQLSGSGYFAADAEVCDPADVGADYTIVMEGDLEGCLHTYVDDFECSPSGTYREVGRELFVGTYNGVSGSFWTTYKFEAKYEGCAEDGSYLGAEIKGRCQHPLINGSGEGVFEGVAGRLDFKDDIQGSSITYYYRGHLKNLN